MHHSRQAQPNTPRPLEQEQPATLLSPARTTGDVPAGAVRLCAWHALAQSSGLLAAPPLQLDKLSPAELGGAQATLHPALAPWAPL